MSSPDLASEEALRRRPWAVLDSALVLAATLFVLWQLRPGLIFAHTTPTGIDLGGHVWGPDELRSHLPGLAGWTDDFFAGFPAYRLYMPVPALFVLAVDTVLPYGVALKVVVALGPVLLPLAVWAMARLARLRSPIPACMAFGTLGFLFDDSYWRFGGNIRSQLAGEFSYGLGLLFVPLALGLLVVVLESGRRRAPAGLICGLAALCHPVVAVMLTVGIVALTAASMWVAPHERVLRLRRVAPVTVLAALLTSFWTLPFAWYRDEVNNLEQTRETDWLELFLPLPIWAELFVVVLAGFGAYVAVRQRRPILLAIGATGVAAFLLVLTLPDGTFANGRPLAFWHLARWLLAGAGFAEVAELAGRRRLELARVLPIAGLVGLVLPIGAITGSLPFSDDRIVKTDQGSVERTRWLFLPESEKSIIPLWTRENFGGYERNPRYEEYRSIIDSMSEVARTRGCGRVLIENDPFNRYGSGYQWELLAYWTDGCLRTTGGLPGDVSRTIPFTDVANSAASERPRKAQPGVPTLAPTDVTAAVPMFQELGVRYYVAWSRTARSQAREAAGLDYLGTVQGWDVFEVVGTRLVQGLAPGGLQRIDHLSTKQWRAVALTFFATGGVRRPVQGALPPLGGSTRPVRVSNVRFREGRIHFEVNRTGAPVLVRTTYFPWWRAKGAGGPWRASPNFMVVVPTQRAVTLSASPRGVDQAGWALTLGALLGLVDLGVYDWRRARQST